MVIGGGPAGFLPFVLNTFFMIDNTELLKAVETAIEGTDLFIVEATVTPAKSIIVELDGPDGLDIDTCTDITRRIEEQFPEDELGEYDLEVGSAGLTAPFKVRGQWEKNLGNEIELITTDGRKLTGVLKELGDDNFTIEYQVKEKVEGKKRPELVARTEQLPFSAVKSAHYLLRFK